MPVPILGRHRWGGPRCRPVVDGHPLLVPALAFPLVFLVQAATPRRRPLVSMLLHPWGRFGGLEARFADVAGFPDGLGVVVI